MIVLFGAYMSYVFVGGYLQSIKESKPVITATSNFDIAEISKHNVKKDCWLLINNEVYDVSAFLAAHPGGVSTITPYCGKESTAAFTGHSNKADNMLNQYIIDKLK